ncbi:MAG: nucleotidyltransferase family protein [Chloroflexi bacterium]|nr:nucleotidyltransferase family protein [Chloroflexota bacterium]
MLQAALLGGERAAQAYHQWERQVDIETIDMGSFRLLPLLYDNLIRHQIPSRHHQRLRGVYRRTWASNQLLFRYAADELRRFQAVGIPVCLLKGSALARQIYQDHGLRPMLDFDFGVQPERAQAAYELLVRSGWRYKYGELPPDFWLERRAVNMVGPLGLELDLHWFFYAKQPFEDFNREVWSQADPIQFGDLSALALNPTDLLITVCLQGFRWDPIPPMRWVADAVWVLRQAGPRIDWDLLLARAGTLEIAPQLARAFVYLARGFEVKIPNSLLANLRGTPTHFSARINAYFQFRRPWPVVGEFLHQYLWSRRMPKYRGLSFIRHLQRLWDLDSAAAVPFTAVARTWRMVLRALGLSA